LLLAADPALGSRGFAFALTAQHERRELVAVCRTLLAFGVLQRVAGDEDAFVQTGGEQADALYDVQRRALAGMLAAVRGPSTWSEADAPVSLDERLHALVDEHLADSDEARRTRLRHRLARRLLDDPVVYLEDLNEDDRAYFANQRGAMAARLAEASGMASEQRAEGSALTDTDADLSDLTLPDEGTDAHVTLLVAGWLARRLRRGEPRAELGAIEAQIAALREPFGRYWRKSARASGSEAELAAIAVKRLEALGLLQRDGEAVFARPALARYGDGA